MTYSGQYGLTTPKSVSAKLLQYRNAAQAAVKSGQDGVNSG